MKTSESIKNLTKALLSAQAKMGSAVKGSKNPFFKSNYADLPTVMEVVKEPLNESGILVLQPASFIEGKNFISTTLIHGETGEYISANTEVICAKQNDPQAFGAAQTYARRFGLQSMLFIPAEDDDGNYAAGRSAAKPTTQVAPSTVAAAKEVIAVAKEMTAATAVEPTVKTSTFRKGTKAIADAVVAKVANTETQSDMWE